MKIEQHIEIDQPPSVVYNFMMDEENLPLWITNFVRMEEVSGEPGEVGAISNHFYDERGRTIEMMEEITALKENELMRADYESKHFNMTITNKLKALQDANATQLTVISEIEMKSFLMRLFSPIYKKNMTRRLATDLSRLKDAIEELTDIE